MTVTETGTYNGISVTPTVSNASGNNSTLTLVVSHLSTTPAIVVAPVRRSMWCLVLVRWTTGTGLWCYVVEGLVVVGVALACSDARSRVVCPYCMCLSVK